MLDIIEMMFAANAGPFTLDIASSAYNPNIPALASAAGWNGFVPLTVNITAPLINQLILPATWSFPGGLTIKISASTRVGGTANGGTAIQARVPVKIDNAGIISGGGGRGGDGGGCDGVSSSTGTYYGATGGTGGTGQGFSGTTTTVLPNSSGGSGQFVQEPSGGSTGTTPVTLNSGSGGSGGAWGATGTSGSTGTASGGNSPRVGAPGAGSPAGYYIDGNSYVTWINTGTRLGRVI